MNDTSSSPDGRTLSGPPGVATSGLSYSELPQTRETLQNYRIRGLETRVKLLSEANFGFRERIAQLEKDLQEIKKTSCKEQC